MGVIAIRDDNDVWGASSALIYDIIKFSISLNGEKGYLVDFRNQFDWGYNSIDIYTLNIDQRVEFLSSIMNYLESGAYEKFPYSPLEVQDKINDLIYRIKYMIH